jgi:hypothetical protein
MFLVNEVVCSLNSVYLDCSFLGLILCSVTKVLEELTAPMLMVGMGNRHANISLQQCQDSTPPCHVFLDPFLYKSVDNFFTSLTTHLSD